MYRAERKIAEMERELLAGSGNTMAKAEALAKELFHIPGSMLTEEERVHMWQETCQPVLQPPKSCSIFPAVEQYRTPNGICNNVHYPLFGAAGTNFRRLIAGRYEDGVSSPRGNLQNRLYLNNLDSFSPPNPSARFVSAEIVADRNEEENPFSHLLMQWGQFLDHDLDLSPELEEEECDSCTFTELCNPIRVPPNDSAFGFGTQNDGDCLAFRRSLPGCKEYELGSFPGREQINDVTSFIDGSMIYGSSEEVSVALREHQGGRLRVGPNLPAQKPSLPLIEPETARFVACPDRDDCFLCGDSRCNEHISLSIMHTIWMREHNRCAGELANINQHWEDERLYQECRRIVGALIQKITYEDYLPKVFGPDNFKRFVGPYSDYNHEVDPGVPNAFAAAAYRYGHSLVRPYLDRLDAHFNSLGPLSLIDAFFNPSQFNESGGTDPIARGWLSKNSLRVDEFLNTVLTTQLFQTPVSAGFDLAALNIQRGRDHGLPPYPIWRNFCDKMFSIDMTPFENQVTKAHFMDIYGSLDTVDLWVGGLAEERLPDSLLGATFACILGYTFRNVRDGDRFYYERDRLFLSNQLQSIRQDSLSRVLCDNLDDLKEIQPDAFLTNQTRVSCDSISRLDLNLFEEEPCYIRISVAPLDFSVTVETGAKVNTLNFLFFSTTFDASLETTHKCQEILCPTQFDDLFVRVEAIRTIDQERMPVNITPNSLLPPPKAGVRPTTYRGRWGRSLFESGTLGLYLNEAECVDGSQNAFVIETTAAVAEDDGHGPLPQDSACNAVSSSKSACKEEEEKILSDDVLLQELNNLLKDIEH